jgi:hypothetical protein
MLGQCAISKVNSVAEDVALDLAFGFVQGPRRPGTNPFSTPHDEAKGSIDKLGIKAAAPILIPTNILRLP